MENRFRDFQSRLVAVERGLQQLLEARLHLEQEAGALREHMNVMCLAMVVDLTRHRDALGDQCASPGPGTVAQHRDAVGRPVFRRVRHDAKPASGVLLLPAQHVVPSWERTPSAPRPRGARGLCWSWSHGHLQDQGLLGGGGGGGMPSHRPDGDGEFSTHFVLHEDPRVGEEQDRFRKEGAIPQHVRVHPTDEECDHIFLVYSSCSLASPTYVSTNL